MKTYDELYNDVKRAVDEYFEQAYDDDWHCGAYHAYRYVLDRLEEIREVEGKQNELGVMSDE